MLYLSHHYEMLHKLESLTSKDRRKSLVNYFSDLTGIALRTVTLATQK